MTRRQNISEILMDNRIRLSYISLHPNPQPKKNNMLTEEQKEIFRKAVDFWSGDKSGTLECPLVDSNDDVVSSQECVEDFKKHAAFVEKETAFGTLLVAQNHQVAKGRRRGDAFVMDFGTARASFFTGGPL